MQLRYFTEEAFANLYGSVAENRDWYVDKGADPHEIGITAESYKDSVVDLPEFSPISLPAGSNNEAKSANDLSNIKIVYDAWKALTPIQARNKYFWSYYTHCDKRCKEYIISRWFDGDDSPSASKILNRFFVSDNRRNVVRESALSSLWWMGYSTYDETNKNNPFWITELLGGTTNISDFLDTFNSFSRHRARAMARGIREYLDYRNLDKLDMDLFRELNKAINRRSVVSPFDCMEEGELQEIVFQMLLSSSWDSARY